MQCHGDTDTGRSSADDHGVVELGDEGSLGMGSPREGHLVRGYLNGNTNRLPSPKCGVITLIPTA